MNRWPYGLAAILVTLMGLPLFGLITTIHPGDVVDGLSHPLFVPALFTSLRTTVTSLVVVIVTGTPLAWWLSRRSTGISKSIERLTELPVLLPPAVVGIGLLAAFRPDGWLSHLPVRVSFSFFAVVLAQVVVAAPYFVHTAVRAFRTVDDELLLTARTLGATRTQLVRTIILPLALPGLLAGAGLAWARALGEFGGTLLFAGNATGTTQTLPLAIYTALQSDVRVAVVFALALAIVGTLTLILAGWLRR